MAGRGGIVVASVFLLVLAIQWDDAHAARPMGAPKTDAAVPRLERLRKLAYDYSRDSDASWDAYGLSTDTSDVESNDVEDSFINSPETAVVQTSDEFSVRDPNDDTVYFDTSKADTVYSAASTDHWNWGSDGDIFLNGAFLTGSGAKASSAVAYAKAFSTSSRPGNLVPAICKSAGPL